jgi:hypothetical protein
VLSFRPSIHPSRERRRRRRLAASAYSKAKLKGKKRKLQIEESIMVDVAPYCEGKSWVSVKRLCALGILLCCGVLGNRKGKQSKNRLLSILIFGSDRSICTKPVGSP